ncbi:MAG: M50 family metallopeptidase [Alphaproteobacteria bacterium]|nr:M50 family metallopeptidase [Alphaproteobacteria bacterium]
MGMGTPYPLGKLFGVMVRMDVTLFVLAAFFVAQGFINGGLTGALNAGTFAVLLFFSIYLHEMGHALGAALFKIRTLDVTLTFFGGYARLAGNPRTPFQQIVVSFAGPAANLLIAAVLYWYSASAEGESFLVRSLAYANLFLGIFNLLPGFPLDGGKIAAATLSNFMPSNRARVITGYIGIGVGLLVIIWGFQSGGLGMLNLLIGFMLIMAASQEIQSAGGGRF